MSRAPREPPPDPRAVAEARRDQRGVALVMVLGALSILTVLLTEFQEDASAESAAALADRDALKAEYVARSAVNLSRLIISAEPTMRAPVTPFLAIAFGGSVPQIPVWEFADQLLGAFNDAEANKSFADVAGIDLKKGKNLGMKGAKFVLNIVDEDSKINVNQASLSLVGQLQVAGEMFGLTAGPQYDPMFEQRDADGNFHDRRAICSALIDWTDSDEVLFPCEFTAQASATGAEDSYYQLLRQPYRRKNAPFDSVEELRYVRGFSDDFWATFVDPDTSNPKKRTLTVWGSGKVNINTANALTLLGVLCDPTVAQANQPMCEDPAQKMKLLTAINFARQMLVGFPIFGGPSAFLKMVQGQGPFGAMFKDGLGIEPLKLKSESEAKKRLSAESKVFSIYADGVVPGYRRTTTVRVHAVVDFRDAPPPGMGFAGIPVTPLGSGSAAAPAPTTVVGGRPTIGGTGAQGADALAGALVKNPGGTVVYFRVE